MSEFPVSAERELVQPANIPGALARSAALQLRSAGAVAAPAFPPTLNRSFWRKEDLIENRQRRPHGGASPARLIG